MTVRGTWHASVGEAEAVLADPGADRAYYLLHSGSMTLGVYAPRGVDDQEAHTQDEVYIVRKGTAELVKGEHKVRLGPGDVALVEAGAAHRFEDFSDDFETWVVFWGPPGGEHSPLQDA